MFQSFESTARPEQGPPRLAALRDRLAGEGLAGYLVPRADAHQGEYVAAHDERLAWLTGFTGSAGFCIVLPKVAGVFVDGRYRVQVKAQVALSDFTPVDWPETRPAEWLKQMLPGGGVIGFDPWLHTADEIEKIEQGLAGTGISLKPGENLVDAIWTDQPPPPRGQVIVHPLDIAGESSSEKRRRLGSVLTEAGQKAAVITLPDSISWLLNIRGSDIPRNPVVQAFAVLFEDGRLTLFIDPAKLDDEVRAHLGDEVTLAAPEALPAALFALSGPVRVDRATAPLAIWQILESGRVTATAGQDPCILPKARKNSAELAGMRAAHLRDAAAMVEFLAWLDAAAPGKLTEIDVVKKLEGFRRATNSLREISFETICGAGPHGALPHYRVTEESNRPLGQGDLLVVDSGGQYPDGTTDITRTIAVGSPPAGAADAFTRVLQGMIAVSRARWPKGLAGRDLDGFARYNLWLAGLDYDHGTGHGVGAYLSVHEGPARISRISDVPLEPGMILSNEPGYYREGAFGIRVENLVVVEPAPDLPGGDPRSMLQFETLTFVPIDRSLIEIGLLSGAERSWIDSYHATVRERIAPRVGDFARAWLERATAPL